VVPLGLLTVAASMDDCEVLDLNTVADPIPALKRCLSRMKPRRIGFSLRNADTTNPFDPFSYIPAFLRQVRLASEILPNADIAVGGGGYSLFHSEIEAAAPVITGGTVGHWENSLPRPRWDLVDLEPYLPFQGNLSVGIEAGRGCNLACSYCVYPSLSGRVVMSKRSSLLSEEAALLKKRGVSHIFLCAPVLNHSPGAGEEAAMAVAASGLTWEAYHTPLGFTAEYAGIIRKAGCTAVSFSPDGGREEDMASLGKNFGLPETASAIRVASEAGLKVYIGVFPYLPGSSPMAMTLAFLTARRWGALAGERLARLRFGAIRRLPGSAFGDGAPCFDSRVPLSEFVLPPAPWMGLFRFLRTALERRLH